jgi:hypothetical protein
LCRLSDGHGRANGLGGSLASANVTHKGKQEAFATIVLH